MNNQQICVVIPHAGSIEMLSQQLAALAEQTVSPAQIVISCNRPGGYAALQQKLAVDAATTTLPLLLIDSSSTPGPSAARNAGWQAANPAIELVLFCDDDDIVDSGWVAALSGALASEAAPGIVAGSLHFEALNSAAAAFSNGGAETAAATKFDHLPYAASANLGIKREVLVACAGFDETLHCAEDIDLSWRAQYLGYGFGFAPAAIVQYRLRGSVGAAYKQSYRYALFDGPLLRRHRARGAKRTLAAGVKEAAGILLAFGRQFVGKANGSDVLRRLGSLFGRIVSSVRYRVWVV